MEGSRGVVEGKEREYRFLLNCGLVQEVLGGFEKCRACNCGAGTYGDGICEPRKLVRGFRQCEEKLSGSVFLELNNNSLEFILVSITAMRSGVW